MSHICIIYCLAASLARENQFSTAALLLLVVLCWLRRVWADQSEETGSCSTGQYEKTDVASFWANTDSILQRTGNDSSDAILLLKEAPALLALSSRTFSSSLSFSLLICASISSYKWRISLSCVAAFLQRRVVTGYQTYHSHQGSWWIDYPGNRTALLSRLSLRLYYSLCICNNPCKYLKHTHTHSWLHFQKNTEWYLHSLWHLLRPQQPISKV